MICGLHGVRGAPRSVHAASVTGVSGLSRRDMAVPTPGLDLRSWERPDSKGRCHAEPSATRAIGRFVADDPPQPRAPRHSRSERLPAVDTGQPDHGGVHDRGIDVPDPVDTGAAVNQRIHAKVHVEPESPSTMVRARTDQRKGFALVAAVVAASAGVSAGLVWGMHLLPHSPRSVSVVPLDGSQTAARMHDSARGATDGLESTGYPGPAVDPDQRPTPERGLDDSDGSLQDYPSDDATLGADQDSSSLTDPDESSGAPGSHSSGSSRSGTPTDGLDTGAPADSPGFGHPDGSAPTTGPRTRQQPQGYGYPSYSRYPDGGSSFPRDPDRSRPALPRVDQDSVPGLGGLSQP
jgi:hypothetical protein